MNQDKKYKGEPCELIIGDRNTIREFSTYHIGTVQGGGVTRLGHDNWMMAYTHLAHDCVVGNHTIFANNSQLAGHVQVGDWVILGGFTVVHQFVRLGAHSMTAMCSLLFADLPPFVMCQGQPAAARSMACPPPTEPVKFTKLNARAAIRLSVVAWSSTTFWNTSAGTPASWKAWARRSPTRRVCEACFKTTVFPAIKAGARVLMVVR